MAKSGFNLLELIITLAIISILTTIAYPSYHHYAIRVKRTQAATTLLNMAMALATYHANNGTYEGATMAELGIEYPDAYHFTINSLTKDSFILAAKPQGQQLYDICGTLQLDDHGKKSVTGTGSIIECW